MRNLNSTSLLSKTASHRKAMFGNMAASLFLKERIITTKQKAKALKEFSEKMITRAKRNLVLADADVAKKIHNKREILKSMGDRDACAKLFDDIAVRFKDRKGGYTRIILLDRRPGDAAEKAIIELVVKKAPVKKAKDEGADKAKGKEKTKEKAKPADKKAKKEAK
jgi:large subunit ribosomal protein L17